MTSLRRATALPVLRPFWGTPQRFDSLFDDLFAPVKSEVDFRPQLDIFEDKNSYQITVELAGIDKKDVEVVVQDDQLVIKGEKKFTQEAEDEGQSYRERRFGSFQRSLVLGPDVDRDKVDANFNNGVLTLTLPKTEKAISRAKPIKIT